MQETYQDGAAVGLVVVLVWGCRGSIGTNMCTYHRESLCPLPLWTVGLRMGGGKGGLGEPVGGIRWGGCSWMV